MTTIIRAEGPARFLSLVPHLLGFAPTASLVLIPFSGSRSAGAMRFDLPVAAADDDIARVAATCIGMVCRREDADAVAVVVYAPVALHERAEGLPHRPLVDAISVRADACGLELRDALCVADDAWARYGARGSTPALESLDDLAVGEAVALPPLRPGDQAAGCDLPTVPPSVVGRSTRALESLDSAVRLLCGDDGAAARARSADAPVDPQALVAACRFDDPPRLFEVALGWSAPTLAPLDAATLVWCLARPSLRDVALMQWCGDLRDGEAALEAQLRWQGGEPYPADLGMRMWGEGPTPDGERLGTAVELVRQAAARVRPTARPGALATCAWLSWAMGRSTHAERYARAACDIEPEHGLAEIVLSFVAVGHVPEWAFHTGSPAMAG